MSALLEATEADRSNLAHRLASGRFDVLKQNLRNHFGWVLSLFLVGLGVKFWLIQSSGSPFPYWDEWEGEAIDVFIPWVQHQFSLLKLFQAHNEHRIVFTKICELGLFLANGQWDSRLEMVFNAFVHSGAIACFGWLLVSLLGKKTWPFVWVLLALTLVTPYAWENTIWGFQSQFYFMVICSILTIWLLGTSEPLSPRWRLGAYAAIGTLFTMASGFLAAAAVVGITLVEVFKQRQNWRRHLPTWGFCIAISIAGLLLKKDVDFHHQFQAHSAGMFFAALGKSLSWPWATKAWYAFFNMVPFAVFGWIYLRSKEQSKPAEQLILGIGFWVGLQSLAAAYARGSTGGAPAWRYMDLLSFIMVVNCISIFFLATRYRELLRFQGFWGLVFAFWFIGCLTGLWFLTDKAMNKFIPEVVFEKQSQLKVARAFLTTDDLNALQHEPTESRIVPNLEAEVWLLRHPVVRSILPACARQALPVVPKEDGDHAFSRNGWDLIEPDPATEISWGCYSAKGFGARGTFESLPVRMSALPYLEIPVAGDLGQAGLSLELVEISTGKSTPIRPTRSAGRQWLNAYVAAPAGEFKIVGHNSDETKWFAFKAPREMGLLSFWSMRLLSGWKYLLLAGIVGVSLELGRFLTNRPVAEHSVGGS